MLFTKAVVVFGLVAASNAVSIRERHGLARREATHVKRQGDNKCLQQNAIQTGSQSDGQDPPVDGQRKSATDDANFINFCSGSTLTNGEQVQGGSCNGIPMGKIPSKGNMISAIIVSPKPGETIQAGQTFTMSVQVQNLEAGAFTNAQKTYYAAPQDLQNGKVIGHTHLTVQDLGGSLEPTNPPNPEVFAFFKGINDAGNNNGLLSAVVTDGLPAGNYRVCSMTSASNHQPALMPVAQRGAQDDCQKFIVADNAGGNGGNNNNNGGNNNNAGQNNGGQNNAGQNNGGQNNAGQNNGGQNNAGQNNGGQNNGAQNGGNNQGGNGGNGGNNNAGGAGGAGGNNNQGGNGGNGGNNNAGGAGGAVGGVALQAVTDSGNADRPFAFNGDTFVNESAAKQRACDVQRNGCLNAFNSGGQGFTIQDCETQATACNAAA